MKIFCSVSSSVISFVYVDVAKNCAAKREPAHMEFDASSGKLTQENEQIIVCVCCSRGWNANTNSEQCER